MERIARITLFVFNFLFFVCGVLLLSFGIVGIVNPTALTNCVSWVPGVQQMAVIIDIPSVIVSSAVFMIVLGSFTMVFGFLGCGGIVFSAKWMLFFYWVFLAILMTLEFILLIFAACNPDKVAASTQLIMLKSLQKKFQPVSFTGKEIKMPSDVVALSWVSMQFEVGCCGVYNYTDYQTFTWNNTIVLPSKASVVAKIPPSCCTIHGEKRTPLNTDAFINLNSCIVLGESFFNKKGCYTCVHDLIVEYSYVPIGICVASIVVESVALAMAVYLWKMKDKTPKHA